MSYIIVIHTILTYVGDFFLRQQVYTQYYLASQRNVLFNDKKYQVWKKVLFHLAALSVAVDRTRQERDSYPNESASVKVLCSSPKQKKKFAETITSQLVYRLARQSRTKRQQRGRYKKEFNTATYVFGLQKIISLTRFGCLSVYLHFPP